MKQKHTLVKENEVEAEQLADQEEPQLGEVHNHIEVVEEKENKGHTSEEE